MSHVRGFRHEVGQAQPGWRRRLPLYGHEKQRLGNNTISMDNLRWLDDGCLLPKQALCHTRTLFLQGVRCRKKMPAAMQMMVIFRV